MNKNTFTLVPNLKCGNLVALVDLSSQVKPLNLKLRASQIIELAPD